MSRAKPKQSQLHATFHTRLAPNGKPRRNRDGSLSILALVRVPKFKPVSRTFKTQEEAEAWAIPRAQELIAQRKQGSVRPSLSTLTVAQLINQYLDDPRTEALGSYEDYADRAHWWRTHYGEVKVLDFGVAVLYEARDKLRSSGRRKARTAGTVNRHLSVMRLIWNWGRSAGWLPQERVWPTKLHLQEPAGRTRFLSLTELNALLKTAETDAVMRAAILASVATGVRQGELLRLKWADVDFAHGWITILETKTATPRRVHLTAQAVSALEGLKAAKVSSLVHVFLDRDGTALTQSKLEMYWRRIRAAAGLKDFRWHDLRHTCASILAQNGATLLEIGSVLGHKSPSNDAVRAPCAGRARQGARGAGRAAARVTVKQELAELLNEMRVSLPHFGLDAALAATVRERADQLQAMLARARAGELIDPDELAWHAFNLGGLWGQPMVDKYFQRLNPEQKRGRDLAAGKRRKKKERLFAEIDKLLAKHTKNAEITRAVMPEFGTKAEDRKADEYGLLRERTIRGYVAERRALLSK